MKRCSRCDRWLELSAFTRHRGRPDGLQPFCRECQRAAVRDHYSRNVAYYLAKATIRNKLRRTPFNQQVHALKAAPCTDCGKAFPPWAMDFDHVRGEKRFNISGAAAYTIDLLRAELEKCELVCSNCHRLRTQARRRMVRESTPDP